MLEQFHTLADGRKLCYARYGNPGALPVLYFHGTPSSRLEPTLLTAHGIPLDKWLQAAGLQLIAIDRPGMGGSGMDASGDFVSFAADVHALMQALKIAQATVIAWSGGGPYALAMAARYPDAVHHVQIICGFSRQFDADIEKQMGRNRWYFQTAMRAPSVLRGLMNVLRRRRVRSTMPRWLTGLPQADYQYIDTAIKLEMLATATMKEAARQGARGPVYEARGYYRPFGFDLRNIEVPVHYWWGTKDMSVIRWHAEEVEHRVPHAVMHYREGEGHLSLYIRHFEAVLHEIAVQYKRGR